MRDLPDLLYGIYERSRALGLQGFGVLGFQVWSFSFFVCFFVKLLFPTAD